MPTSFPMGWIIITLTFIYVYYTKDIKLLYYVIAGFVIVYTIAYINIARAKEAIKR